MNSFLETKSKCESPEKILNQNLRNRKKKKLEKKSKKPNFRFSN